MGVKRKQSSNKSNISTSRRKKKAKVTEPPAENESDYFRLAKPEVRLAEAKLGFGEVDNLPDVKEVRDPSELETNAAAGSTTSGSNDASTELFEDSDDEIQLVSSNMEKQLFPHQREYCQTHKFHPQNIFKGNHITCMKCYCFICDKPASECEEWFNPERPNALNEHHCNAYPSKDSPHWQVKKWLKLNPVQNLLVNLTNPKDSDGTTQQKGTPYELHAEFQRVRLRMDRSWRLYEAGEAKMKKVGRATKSVLIHNFKHVTSWFQKLFFATRMVKNEEKWISKFVILDAMTEVMVARTWRPPKHASTESEWDPAAEKTSSRIMLSLGSRWLTCYAKCSEEHRFELSKAIQTRILHLKMLAKESTIFNSGFSVILSLSRHGQNTSSAAKDVLKACSNLYRSILRRRLHHVKLPDSDKNAGPKYHEVCMKDSIMLPFLKSIKDHNIEYCDETSITKRCEGLSSKCKFYHEPCIDNWKNMFENNTDQQILTQDDVNDSFNFIKLSLDAKYSFSTRRKIKFKKIVNYTLCYFHIAFSLAADHATVSREAFTLTNKGMEVLLDIIKEYHGRTTPIESLIFQLCMQVTTLYIQFFTERVPKGTNPTNPKMPGHIKDKLYKMWPQILKLYNVAWNLKDDKYANEKNNILNKYKMISRDDKKRHTYYVFQELGMITSFLLDPKIETGAIYWQCEFVKTSESYKRLRQYAKIMGKSDIKKLLPSFTINKLKREADMLSGILKSDGKKDSTSTMETISIEPNRQPKGLKVHRMRDGNSFEVVKYDSNNSSASTVGYVSSISNTTATTTGGARSLAAQSMSRSAIDNNNNNNDNDKNSGKNGIGGDDYAKWTKYGSNHQLSTSKKHVERIEKGNPNLVTWYQHTFDKTPLGIKVDCQSGEPVIRVIPDKVKEAVKNIKEGDIIQSINDKYVQDLWRFLPLDIRQEDFLVRNPENTEELVPCQFIANAMKEEFEKFLHKTTSPVHVCFVRNV